MPHIINFDGQFEAEYRNGVLWHIISYVDAIGERTEPVVHLPRHKTWDAVRHQIADLPYIPEPAPGPDPIPDPGPDLAPILEADFTISGVVGDTCTAGRYRRRLRECHKTDCFQSASGC